MQELDLRSILYLLLAKIKWIVLGLVVGALLFCCFTALFVPVKYTSKALVYVSNASADHVSDETTTSSLAAAERLVKTLRVASTTEFSLQNASQRLNGQITPKELLKAVAFSGIEETSILQVSVTHTDPVLAQEACFVMAETAVSSFSSTGEIGEAHVMDGAATKAVKTSPNVGKNTVLGALIGSLLVIVVVVLQALLNNTIRDKEDLQSRIDIPVLGEIPSFDLAVKGGRKHG